MQQTNPNPPTNKPKRAVKALNEDPTTAAEEEAPEGANARHAAPTGQFFWGTPKEAVRFFSRSKTAYLEERRLPTWRNVDRRFREMSLEDYVASNGGESSLPQLVEVQPPPGWFIKTTRVGA